MKYIPYILIYFIIISLIGILMTVYDKSAAIAGKRRISENSLITVGFLGAAVPMFITMNFICHKTKHPKFMLGLPLEAILHLGIIFAVGYIMSK